jgi:hypothetical protein
MPCFIISADGEKTTLDAAPRNLDEACSALNSSGIEIVSGVDQYEGEPAQMVVDEDHARKKLPLNASAIAIRDAAYAARGISSADPIFGSALILTGSDRLR